MRMEIDARSPRPRNDIGPGVIEIRCATSTPMDWERGLEAIMTSRPPIARRRPSDPNESKRSSNRLTAHAAIPATTTGAA